MGRKKCLICGINNLNTNVSFHRFNKNSHISWCENLNVDPKQIPKYAFICSNHFRSEDVLSVGGRRYLSSQAFPLRSIENLQKPESDSSEKENQSFGSETTRDGSFDGKENIVEQKVNFQNIQQEDDVEDENISITSQGSSDTVTVTSPSSSTITVSEEEINSQRSTTLHSLNSSETNKRKQTDVQEDDQIKENVPVPPTSKRQRTSSRLHYFGDIRIEDLENPRRRKICWTIAKKTVAMQAQRIKALQNRNRWLVSTVYSLKSFTKHLRQKNLISENAQLSLNGTMSKASELLFRRLLKRQKKGKYPPELRQFALTLNFYSKKAYEYVRQKFSNVLPHIRTLASWIATVNASPGFMLEAKNALKIKAAEAGLKGYKILCNLILDEMSIRKKIEWDGHKTYGYVDVGTMVEGDNLEEAREALVLMVVALNAHWKIPVGYFMTNGLNGEEKANIVRQSLEFVHEADIIVTSITFDGAASNISMAKFLGANLNNSHLQTHFPHPITGEKVYIFLDACHMVKLIRNCFGTKKYLENGDGKPISWDFIKNLYEIQQNEQLHAGNKLGKRHIQWTKEKMKVSLAVQTLSNSVASALDWLNHKMKIRAFENSDATSEFCRIINNLFDTLNSKSRFSKKEYEKPLSETTEQKYLDYIDLNIKYLENLKLENVNIMDSTRKTGFLGLKICLISLKQLYQDRVKTSMELKYILSYKLSQDHLEIFFGCVRSKGGYNNNPTSRQFQAAMRRLLVHAEVRGSEQGNAIALDSTSVLHCSSASPKNLYKNVELDNCEELERICDEHNYYSLPRLFKLSEYVEDVVAYIAGFVVRKVKMIVKCEECIGVIESDIVTSKLVQQKSFGYMSNASQFVIVVCRLGEQYLRYNKELFSKKSITYIQKYLMLQVLKNLPDTLHEAFSNHLFDEEPLSNHFIGLVKIVLDMFFKVRLHYETSKIQGNDDKIRHILTKTILFKNQ